MWQLQAFLLIHFTITKQYTGMASSDYEESLIETDLRKMDLSLDVTEFQPWFRLFATILGLVGIILSALNIVVLAKMTYRKVAFYHKDHYRLFLITLSCIDINTSVWIGLFASEPSQTLLREVKTLCVSSTSMAHIGFVCWTVLFVLMSIDRLLAIKKPEKYGRLWITKKLHLCLLGAFAAVFCIYLGIALHLGSKGYEPKGLGYCRFSLVHAQGFPLLATFAGIVGIIILTTHYSLALYYIHRKSCRIIPYNRTIQHRRTETTKVVLTLIISHNILWLPPVLFVIFRPFLLDDRTVFNYVNVCCFLLSPIVHPILYGKTSSTYRKTIRAMGNVCWNKINIRG